MTKLKTLAEWMTERGLEPHALAEATGLDHKIVEAIAMRRYLTSPVQRQKLAAALGLSADEIAWGGPVEVEHMYGHGPQFGRSP